ncbi:hypothetical protein PUNSTDRAFT_100328 [Punctularia strigosozonata HHB-11173 SS5]|uniref:uncharacterized protein n=1 Tax=Punctularia strigosozonata (strain HHB-11173) TaxID=741275 RepID=UPI0004417FFE|nr:uncharacterized protein PUNSTDRAFT_100328 [Punctularia strigosozonata HHB-11173 SS5]EIN10651.1 hypothetical protein PUNSTDRAFT_100328 [Punctularia strigosozonata HHB-11173 SS5]
MLETPAATPSKSRTASPFKTPTKHPQAPPSSPTRSSPSKSPARQQRPLPPELVPCLNAQKKAVLAALRDPLALMLESSHMNEDDDEEDDETPEPANVQAHEDLRNLLQGTVERGEGNSCMLVGPRGSGKTKLLDRILSEFSTHEVDPARADDKRPIIIRLSGHAQNNDRLAMREIAWQLAQEVREVTFDEYLTSGDGDEEPIEDPDAQLGPNITLPPSAHLPALIGVLPTLQRPVIVVIDAFDLFAMHPRQSLLYCLLDTVQASYAGSQASGGLAVVGVTTRVDTINLLEKRVKSRFSGRMIRTAGPNTKHRWLCIMRQILTVEPAGVQEVQDSDEDETWSDTWVRMVQIFLDDKKVQGVLEEMYALTRDVRMLNRVLMNLVLRLKPTEPFPSLSNLVAALELQRCPTKFQSLHALPYPAICLLIAAVHTQTSGHDIMTFEMLHELFKDQVRASLSAPVTVAGGGIGMVKCTREVLASAFEHLVSTAVFVPIAGPNASILREFVKYRCAVDRDDVKRAVERQGQINLRKWLAKAGEVR